MSMNWEIFGTIFTIDSAVYDIWLAAKYQERRRAFERFLCSHVLVPVRGFWRALRRRMKPWLIRKLPVWSCRRWKSKT